MDRMCFWVRNPLLILALALSSCALVEEARNPQITNESVLMQEVVATRDVALGMSQDLVKESWGEPLSQELSLTEPQLWSRYCYRRLILVQRRHKTQDFWLYFKKTTLRAWEPVPSCAPHARRDNVYIPSF